MSRVLIISNRLPISVEKNHTGLKFKDSTGGLVTGVSSVFESQQESVWIGWPGIPLEDIEENEQQEILDQLSVKGFHPVFLTQEQVDRHYYGFCNKTIWPLFHYFSLYAVYDADLWDAYREVNEAFYKALLEVYQPGDTVWVHDYHLFLLPELLRREFPEAAVGFFLHIPFPSFELFRNLPWRQEILQGLLGADLIGFHTHDYARHFSDSIRRLLGYDHTFGRVLVDNRLVKIDAFGMGIDYHYLADSIKKPEVESEINNIRKKVENQKVILSIDRLDYSKGIPQRLESYDMFLEANPEYKEKVVLILKIVASRTKIDEYMLLKKQVEELVGRINGKHGTINWMPVWYMYRFMPFSTMLALYGAADVCLITPLRDGMNLIAKEYVAASKNAQGVLVLSETAGAAQELGEALIVNPNNKEEVKNALEEALAMSEEEQKERNLEMQRRLERYNVMQWANTFLYSLAIIKNRQKELQAKALTSDIKHKIVDDYRQSKKALILLDYDGTLVPFSGRPVDAKPDRELVDLLLALSQKPDSEIVIISGRDKNTLDEWLGDFPIAFSAEHGMWIKEKGEDWGILETIEVDWKSEIYPVLELYVDRTPGSFIEEKEFSLAWHYRKVDLPLARARVRELNDELFHLVGNYELSILEGDRVLEIKSARVNKGRAVLHWVSGEEDFILAFGDDQTDEDVFAVLPEKAYTIKVGQGASLARFNLRSYKEVRSLLKEFVR